MLSEDDIPLIERERAINSLALVLDPEALAVLLTRHGLVADGSALAITYLRYKPRTSMIAAFRAGEVHGYVMAVADIARSRLSEAARRREKVAGGVAADEERGIAMYRFPHDRVLERLERIDDDELFRKILRRTSPAFAQAHGATASLLGYKPERRCVFSIGGSHDGVLRFYARDELGTAVHAYTSARSGERLRLPAILGSCERYGTLMTEWLEGAPFDTSDPHALVEVGAALAALHEQHPTASMASPTSPLERLRWSGEAIAAVMPELAVSVERAIARLAATLARSSLSEIVHGDLHPGQVLIERNRIALIDLDRMALGDGRSDLGNLLAHIERDGVVKGIAHGGAAREGLLEGYREGGGRAVESLDAYVAAGLLLLAVEPFRHRGEHWREATAQLVERARELAGSGSGGCFVARTVDLSAEDDTRSGNGTSAPVDPSMPWLADALDPERATRAFVAMERLDPSITGDDVRVVETRLLRHKPARRALIEYAMLVDGRAVTLLGKSRVKGVDRATVEISLRLREAGIREGSTSGVIVPKPVGIVEEHRMWLQERLDGDPPLPLLNGPGGTHLARRIADALHRLHEAGVPGTRRHDLEDELAILHARLRSLMSERPRLSRRLERLLEGCRGLALTMRPVEPVGVHRDFYHDQVLVASDHIAIVDLDLYAIGDPALDVGNFLAHLIEWSVRTTENADALVDVRDAFENRYLELAGDELRENVRAYETLTLARHVQLSTLFADRNHETELLLALCEERLGAVLPAVSGHGTP